MKPTLQLYLLFSTLLCSLTGALAQPPKNFYWQELAHGVFAAVHRSGGHAICNAGVIDLGGSVMVVDPFISPLAAIELKEIIQKTLGKPVSHVIYTHYHNDHIRGAQVFEDAVVISSSATRDLIMKEEPRSIEYDKRNASRKLKEWEDCVVSENDPRAMAEKGEWLDYYGAIVASVNEVVTVLPALTFEESLKVHGSARQVELRNMGAGHTPQDAVVILPQDSIIFTADLLFQESHAWMADGDPFRWLSLLDTLSNLPGKRFVPGHGPVCDRYGIGKFKAYLTTVLETARSYIENGKDPAADSALKAPFPYDQWALSLFFKPNVIFVHRLLMGLP